MPMQCSVASASFFQYVHGAIENENECIEERMLSLPLINYQFRYKPLLIRPE
jgi:hypothetical protein